MSHFMRDLQAHESGVSPGLSNVLARGFVEDQGCVLLASEAHNSAFARVTGTYDETGYECFINHLHTKSLQEALELARRLTRALGERFTSSFTVIVSFDGRQATVRFHKLRPGQVWLDDNLEAYEEGIAVLDTNAHATSES
jgi:hypothetical protein